MAGERTIWRRFGRRAMNAEKGVLVVLKLVCLLSVAAWFYWLSAETMPADDTPAIVGAMPNTYLSAPGLRYREFWSLVRFGLLGMTVGSAVATVGTIMFRDRPSATP